MRQGDAVGFQITAGGDGWRTETQAGGHKGFLRVVGHRILVDGDVSAAQRFLGGFAGDAFADHVDQHQMVFGAAGDDLVAAGDDGIGHRLRILHHLLLIGFELGLQRFLERNRLGRDHVHQRAALDARKHDALQFLFDFRIGFGDDDAAARAAQSLVRGRGDDVGVRYGIWIYARRDETRDVGHIDQKISADLVCDGSETRPVDLLRIGAETAYQHFRLVFDGETFDFVVIDQALIVHAVLHGVEQLAAEVDLGAVGQMAAVGQRHAENGVARIQQRKKHCLIGLRAGMRLHVGIIGPEQLLRALDRQRLGHVDVFAAAVIALARITFCVFVGELAALCLHDPRAGVVLGCDQLDVVFLAAVFRGDGRSQFGVVAFNAGIARKHRRSKGCTGRQEL